MAGLLTKVLGEGSAATCCPYVPDIDYFSGRGAKDVVPLYRDAEATQPNITKGLLEALSGVLGFAVSPEDLFAYTYGILASPSYVKRFSEELTLPGPRLPITKIPELFKQVAALGRKLIGWHTYGERFDGSIPKGKAESKKAVSNKPEDYPEDWDYDPQTKVLKVGEGEFGPVEPEVMNFSVSGLEVVKSWLGYRMKERSGRKSSPLDDIRPETWTFELTRELLELLWVLEATLEVFPELKDLQDQVLAGEVWLESELPKPTEAEREPPKENRKKIADQQELF